MLAPPRPSARAERGAGSGGACAPMGGRGPAPGALGWPPRRSRRTWELGQAGRQHGGAPKALLRSGPAQAAATAAPPAGRLGQLGTLPARHVD